MNWRGLYEAGQKLIVAYYEHHDARHADCAVPIVSKDIDAAVERAETLRRRAADLEAALLHRCVVPEIDPRCEDCQGIIRLVEPASAERGATTGDVLERVWDNPSDAEAFDGR